MYTSYNSTLNNSNNELAMKMAAQLTGYYTDLEEAKNSKKLVKYLVARDGYYQIFNNSIGVFIARTVSMKGSETVSLNAEKLPDLPKVTFNGQELYLAQNGVFEIKDGKPSLIDPSIFQEVSEGVQLENKVPLDIFYKIYFFFKSICSDQGTEVMVQVWLDKTTKEYFCSVPKQRVSGASVHYEVDDNLQNNANLVRAMDIHSHNTMGAFFSSIDDRDERETRLYGVIGDLGKKTGSYLLRTYAGDHFIPLDLDNIFTESVSADYQEGFFPKEWLDNVSFSNAWRSSLSWGSSYTSGYRSSSSYRSRSFYDYDYEEDLYAHAQQNRGRRSIYDINDPDFEQEVMSNQVSLFKYPKTEDISKPEEPEIDFKGLVFELGYLSHKNIEIFVWRLTKHSFPALAYAFKSMGYKIVKDKNSDFFVAEHSLEQASKSLEFLNAISVDLMKLFYHTEYIKPFIQTMSELNYLNMFLEHLLELGYSVESYQTLQ